MAHGREGHFLRLPHGVSQAGNYWFGLGVFRRPFRARADGLLPLGFFQCFMDSAHSILFWERRDLIWPAQPLDQIRQIPRCLRGIQTLHVSFWWGRSDGPDLIQFKFASDLFDLACRHRPLVIDEGADQRVLAQQVDYARNAEGIGVRPFDGLRSKNRLTIGPSNAQPLGDVAARFFQVQRV